MYLTLCITNCPTSGHPAPLQSKDTKKDILLAKEIGFDAVEMHLADPTAYDWDDISAFLAKENMRLSSIATGTSAIYHGANLTSMNSYIYEYTMRTLKRYIDVSAQTGAGIIIGGMKGPIPGGYDMPAYLDLLYDRFMPAVEYAEKKGGVLLMEAINRYETPIFNTAAETLEFVNRVDSKTIFVHLDTFHMNIEDPDMPAAIRLCGDKLGHIHFADSNRKYCGSGSVDFKAVIDALQEIGYDRACSFEYLPLPSQYESAKLGYDYIKPMMP